MDSHQSSVAVLCGSLRGTFFTIADSGKVNNRNTYVICSDGTRISLTEMERLAGKASAKKWKQSIKIELPNKRIFPIGDWILANFTQPKGPGVDLEHVVKEAFVEQPRSIIVIKEKVTEVELSKSLCGSRLPSIISVFPFVSLLPDNCSIRKGTQPMNIFSEEHLDPHTKLRVFHGNDWSTLPFLFHKGSALLKVFVGKSVGVMHINHLDGMVGDSLEALKRAFENDFFTTKGFTEITIEGSRVSLDERWRTYLMGRFFNLDDPVVLHVQ
jgi:hypothetical protein